MLNQYETQECKMQTIHEDFVPLKRARQEHCQEILEYETRIGVGILPVTALYLVQKGADENHDGYLLG